MCGDERVPTARRSMASSRKDTQSFWLARPGNSGASTPRGGAGQMRQAPPTVGWRRCSGGQRRSSRLRRRPGESGSRGRCIEAGDLEQDRKRWFGDDDGGRHACRNGMQRAVRAVLQRMPLIRRGCGPIARCVDLDQLGSKGGADLDPARAGFVVQNLRHRRCDGRQEDRQARQPGGDRPVCSRKPHAANRTDHWSS